jgi:hypothetical protein
VAEPVRDDARPPCGAEIIGRDGKPLPYRCNLDKDHLGKCAQVYRDSETTGNERTTA